MWACIPFPVFQTPWIILSGQQQNENNIPITFTRTAGSRALKNILKSFKNGLVDLRGSVEVLYTHTYDLYNVNMYIIQTQYLRIEIMAQRENSILFNIKK